jgi:hypothetical protein
MRTTEDPSRQLPNPFLAPKTLARSLRLAACVIGIGLCLASGAARAGDDDDDDDTPVEDKIMRNLMSGLGGTNMDNKGIDYRERSPLVVPRSTDLPPPQFGKQEATAPNWPKDPTVAARKASKEAAKQSKPDIFEMNRTLTPSELAPKKTKTARTDTVQQPGAPDIYGGNAGGPMLVPSQLGFNNGMLSGMFKGNKAEETKWKGEPTRDSLTEPPVGYQTPSPEYPYGTGPMKPIDQQTYNPLDPNSQVKGDR